MIVSKQIRDRFHHIGFHFCVLVRSRVGQRHKAQVDRLLHTQVGQPLQVIPMANGGCVHYALLSFKLHLCFPKIYSLWVTETVQHTFFFPPSILQNLGNQHQCEYQQKGKGKGKGTTARMLNNIPAKASAY